MKKTDIKTLSDVQKFLNGIPYINCGGCGYSAYAIYLWLKKTNFEKIDKVKFVYLYSEVDYFYKTNEAFIKGERTNSTSSSHIMINLAGRKNNTKLIDSSPNGVDLSISKYIDECEFTVTKRHNDIDESILRNSLKFGCWNSMFEKKYIKKIERILDIKFNI